MAGSPAKLEKRKRILHETLYHPDGCSLAARHDLGGARIRRRLGCLARALPEWCLAGNGPYQFHQGHSLANSPRRSFHARHLQGSPVCDQPYRQRRDPEDRVNEQEQVYCVDAATGKDIWHYKFNCFHTDVPDSRVAWASVTVDPETGNIYTNGVQGLVFCLSPDGKLLWSRSTTELYGRVTGYGGRTYTPLIDEDRVIVAFNNSSYGPQAIGSHRF